MLAPDVAPLHPGYICSMAFPFFTIGHSTRPIGEFIEMLRRADVRMVVDVRTIPRSRTNPQYNSETLKESIAEFQIGYEHIVELGGLRGRQREVPSELNAFWQNESFHNYADYALSEPFAHGLARLRALGGERRCAIMCAEAVWWRCHRRIIADYLIAAGEAVFHILSADRTEPAHLTPGIARRADGTLLYPKADVRGQMAEIG
jgi:uncharacterized protein (DUF488 family)